MKLSVSLSQEDVAFLDRETGAGAYESRSAAIAAGVRMLRERQLTDDYRESFAEWAQSDDSELWDRTTADGSV
ncbi:MAG TPA: ribbon-helix-helix domain-containing protein [Pseudolysinimonas sp.]|nr:ribbon-helix-helix domain-containing protein [Pseudolysinimonas sp.]